jgi:hypothetical protein
MKSIGKQIAKKTWLFLGWQQTFKRSKRGHPPGEQWSIVALENETFKECKVGDNSHWPFLLRNMALIQIKTWKNTDCNICDTLYQGDSNCIIL